MELLKEWLDSNSIVHEFESDLIVKIEEHRYILIDAKPLPHDEKQVDVIFTPDFHLNLSDEEEEKVLSLKPDFIIYPFGGKFYSTPVDSISKPKLNLLKYVGKYPLTKPVKFAHLGVHGKYEILNGMGDYELWCKKAKYFSCDALGICEKNTLAGIVAFQVACEKYKLKPIFGMTIVVQINDELHEAKVYVKNKIGWKNLLKIHKEIRIINDGFVKESDLLNCGEGLVFIFNAFYPRQDYEKYKNQFDLIFYQIDSVEWRNDKRDFDYLTSLKDYFKTDLKNIKPILINDSYYLDKDDFKIKKSLNKIAKFNNPDSQSQYFKHINETESIMRPLFENENDYISMMVAGNNHANILCDICTFQLEMGKFHLPKFSTEHLGFTPPNNTDLLIDLLTFALEDKGLMNDQYLERLDLELEIICKGGFVDYFLILWDVIRWCQENNILTGIGRGSAAGSLVSFLLDITRIDPIKFNLLFERFLNEGRIGKSLPDIDTDFEGLRRDDVKRYLEERYGHNFVCSIGSYNAIKIKSGIKDLGRMRGLDFNKLNIMTSIIDLPEGKDGNFDEVFKYALSNGMLKEFIGKNPTLINDLGKVLENPKSEKVHPCATVILPNYGDGDIFTKIPLRKDGDVLVSEWEGEYLEKLGYLKEDILGIKQLDKIRFMLNLIKETVGKDIDIYNLPLDDPKVMHYFKKGFNGDVFQFGSSGLTSFCKEVLPDNFEELTNMVALFRPGPIQSGAHTDYIDIKFQRKEPDYDFGLKSVTEVTFGLYIFQEQVMKACQILGGFNPVETDDIRKAMGKKIQSLLEKFKKLFVDGALKKGCPQDEADLIWDKLVAFSGYGFNRSHAACYALTGYMSQWLKVYYPLQFWTTALQFSEKEYLTLRYMSEIKKTNNIISIVPPDINKSSLEIRSDHKIGNIYWSLGQVKFLGEVGLEYILEERNKNGKFYSIEDFLERVPKAKANKRIIVNLILSGSFDEVYSITNCRDRKKIIEDFYKKRDLKASDDPFLTNPDSKFEWYWILKQKELSGLGVIDYQRLFRESEVMKSKAKEVVESTDFQLSDFSDKWASIGGIIKEIKINHKNSKAPKVLILESNNEEIICNVWSGQWDEWGPAFQKSEGRIVLLSGRISYDSTYKKANIFSLNSKSLVEIL